MRMSESIGEIAQALSMAQSEIRNARKDTQGHGYKYADLAQIIEILRPILPKYGLSFVQPVSSNDEGSLLVSTVVMHKSGEWISTTAQLPEAVLQGGAGKNPIQVAGSAITYMRRYQLAGMFGIAQEDDDAKGYVAPTRRINNNTKKLTSAPEVNWVDQKKFDEKKTEWATWAKDCGEGGLEKLSSGLRGKGLMLTDTQMGELQETIIEMAKSGNSVGAA